MSDMFTYFYLQAKVPMYYNSIKFSQIISHNLVVPNSVDTKDCAFTEPLFFFGEKGGNDATSLSKIPFPQDVKCSTDGIKCGVLR